MYFIKTVNTDQVKIYNKKIVLMSSNEEDKYKCLQPLNRAMTFVIGCKYTV